MRELYNITELGLLAAQKFTFVYPLTVEVTAVQKQDDTLQATFTLLVGEDAIGEFTQEYDSIERLLDAFDIADHDELFELASEPGTKGTSMNIEEYQGAAKRTCVTADRDGTRTLALPGQASVSILHKLDVGRHTLLLLSDGSLDLLVTQEQTPALAQPGLHLESEETYRLFISLHEQFKHTDVYPGDERTRKFTDSSPLAKK